MGTTNARGTSEDPFVVLGVSHSCTLAELKQAYRLLARRYHPDVNPSPEAAAEMSRINQAFDRAWARVVATERFSPAASALPQPRPSSSTNEHAAQRPGSHPPPEPTRTHAPVAGLAVGAIDVTSGVSAVVGRSTQARRPRKRLRLIWLAGAVVTVMMVVVGRALMTTPPSTPGGMRASHIPTTLRLGGVTTFSWSDAGAVTTTEDLLALTPGGLTLREPPQWAPDGTYVALSVRPLQNVGDVSTSNIMLLQGSHVLATLQGVSGRWSPVADQLGVLTGPGPGVDSHLEVVTPDASASPTTLDAHAGSHLAWSADGAQILYNADGQQKLRSSTLTPGSARTLLTELGHHLSPLGWQGSHLITVVHSGPSISLVAMDPTVAQSTTLVDLGSTVNEGMVVVSPNDVTYLPRTSGPPFTLLNWPASQQRWQAQLSGVESVEFLAGWSGDGRWLALGATSAQENTSQLCFAYAPVANTPPTAPWTPHCLPLPGLLLGMSWEPKSHVLSYVRAVQPGGQLEVRELHLQEASARSGHSASGHAALPMMTEQNLFLPVFALLPLAIVSGATHRERRFARIRRVLHRL